MFGTGFLVIDFNNISDHTRVLYNVFRKLSEGTNGERKKHKLYKCNFLSPHTFRSCIYACKGKAVERYLFRSAVSRMLLDRWPLFTI